MHAYYVARLQSNDFQATEEWWTKCRCNFQGLSSTSLGGDAPTSNILNSVDLNDAWDSQWTPVNREAETMTQLDTDDGERRERERERRKRRSFAMHVAFSLRKFHIWLESSLSTLGALFINVLNRHARQKRRNTARFCVRASSRLFLPPLSARPSPLFWYVRRERVSRRAMHFPWIGPVIARLIFQSFFPRRERVQRVRDLARGACPPPFIAHLSSCARRLFAMHRPKVAEARAHACTSLTLALFLRHTDALASRVIDNPFVRRVSEGWTVEKLRK